MDLVIPNKSILKTQAKKIKSFLIFIKQKLNRQQISREKKFRLLLALVFNQNAEEDGVLEPSAIPKARNSFFDKKNVCVTVWVNQVEVGLSYTYIKRTKY